MNQTSNEHDHDGPVMPEDVKAEAPPPRAFAQGAGLVLQTVGGILFLSTCCICSVAGLWDPKLTRGEVHELMRQDQLEAITVGNLFEKPARAGLMLIAFLMTAGGLALAGFGLGLQGDKGRAAWGAVATTGAMLAVLAVAGVCLWIDEASIAARVWHALLTLVVLALLPMCIAALRQIIAHPPPPGLEVLPDDFELPKGFH